MTRRALLAILVSALAAGLAGAVVGRQVAPTFEGRARVLVGPVNADLDTIRASASLTRTYAALVVSEPLVESAARRLRRSGDEAIIRSSVDATADDTNRVLTVRVQGGDATTSSATANALVDELVAYVASTPARPEGQLTVLQRAAVATVPISPNIPVIVLLAASGGLLGGFLIVVLIERLSATIARPADLEQVADLRVVGQIDDRRSRRRKQPGPAEASGDLALLTTRLLFAEGGRERGSLAIVGTAEADGSDQVVRTVARILKDSGLSPVVVDAESAERRLSIDAGIADRAGLTDLLRTGGKAENLLHAYGEMTILGYGRGVLDPHVSHRLAALLKRLQQRHHVAVIHVDPRLTANALVVAETADALFVAVRRRAVRSSTLGYLVEVMRVAGVRVEGAILHDMKPGSSDSRPLETAAEPTPAGETLVAKRRPAEPTPPVPEVPLDDRGETDGYSVIDPERGGASGEYGPALDRSGPAELPQREPATSSRPPGVDPDLLGPPSMTSGGG